MDKKSILQLLSKAKKEAIKFGKNYEGPGIVKKFKRFFRYKFSYLVFILERIGFKKEYSFLNSEFDLIKFGFGEIKTLEFLLKKIKSGDVFYDIGANQGLYSILIKECFGDEVEIHLFEPVGEYYKIIQERFKKYLNKNNIYLNQLALSNNIGTLNLKIPTKIRFGFASATIIDDFARKYLKNYKEIETRCITLDEYCKTHKYPNFIKIDVDGAESLIIDGGIYSLSKYNPVIIMEIIGGDLGMKYSLNAATKLYKLGYKIFYISDEFSDELIEFSINDLSNYIKYQNGDNFVFSKEKP